MNETFIVVRVDHAWTVQEYEQVAADIFAMISQVDHPVDLVVDMRQSALPPPHIIQPAGEIMRQRPANHRLTIIISESNLWRKLLRLVVSVFAPDRDQTRMVFADSVDKAYQILENADHRDR